MRPLRPACGTVSNAQLLTLPETIRISAPGVVTTQLSSLPPASSSATEVAGSSESRLATAHPPEPPPTTTKSKVSVTLCPPRFTFLFVIPGWSEGPDPESRDSGLDACASPRNDGFELRHESQKLLQPRDLGAIGRIEIGQPVERRAIEHRLQFAQGLETPFAVIGAGAGGADAAHRLIDLGKVKQAVVDGNAAGHRARQHLVARRIVLAEP